MHMDIFRSDAFSLATLTDTVVKTPYAPHLLGTMGLFQTQPVRTVTVAIEKKENTLAIIQTSPRGAPPEQGRGVKRDIRDFRTVRLAKEDVINADEISGIRAFGSATELQQAQDLIVERQTTLRTDLELTKEMHRLGAVQGKVLDADGTVIKNWFTEWGIAEPTPIQFLLDTSTTDVEKLIRVNVLRAQQRASKGLWMPGSYTAGLCGDSFFDKLTSHKTVRETYLNQQQASALRQAFGVAADQMDGAFAAYKYGGVLFINYRGTDSFDDNATAGINAIGIKSTQCKFFPVNTPGVFKVAYSPAESFETVNTMGREMYSWLLPDVSGRNEHVTVEVRAYPLFICTRPEMLLTANENTNP